LLETVKNTEDAGGKLEKQTKWSHFYDFYEAL